MVEAERLALDRTRIDTLEGEMVAGFGDWIIKGVDGEFYPIKNDIFKATYEKVDDESANRPAHKKSKIVEYYSPRLQSLFMLYVEKVHLSYPHSPYILIMSQTPIVGNINDHEVYAKMISRLNDMHGVGDWVFIGHKD